MPTSFSVLSASTETNCCKIPIALIYPFAGFFGGGEGKRPGFRTLVPRQELHLHVPTAAQDAVPLDRFTFFFVVVRNVMTEFLLLDRVMQYVQELNM